MSLKQDLPLLNALAVFEAAARTSGFTAASRELGIAQSAVSRHVANLEGYFKLKLFDRDGKRLALTPGGQRLADAVATGLGHIRVVLNELRRETEEDILTIGCSYDFAYLWLMPRFGLLRDAFPETEVRLIASHDYADFESQGVDLSVRYGQRSEWPDATCVELFDEEAFPVASPAFIAANAHLIDNPGALRDAPLLYASQRGIQWRHWFGKAGLPPPSLKATTYSNYTAVLYEVLGGRGVALGWKHMLGDLVERGLLVRPFDLTIESDSAFFAVHRAGQGSIADRLAEWLRSSVETRGEILMAATLQSVAPVPPPVEPS